MERNYQEEAEKLILRVEEIMEAYSEIVATAVENNNPKYKRAEAEKYEKELKKLDPNKIIWNGLLIPGLEASVSDEKKGTLKKQRNGKLVNLVIKLLKNKKLKPLD